MNGSHIGRESGIVRQPPCRAFSLKLGGSSQNDAQDEANFVILDDLPQPADTGVDATLDDLFRAAAARRPDAIALVDPPNRSSFTEGAARSLTYAEADRMISFIAGRRKPARGPPSRASAQPRPGGAPTWLP